MSFLFFTSYARDNRASSLDESDLQKFISDLTNEIRQLAPPATDDIAFFDTESIEAGDEWPQALAEAMRKSRLCLCLYSPSYFNSKWCGKEFQVFCDRRNQWLSQSANQGKRPHIFFPVIWIAPRGIPVSIQGFQYMNDKYPKAYREGGLRQLMRLGKFKDDYNEFLAVLAQQIVDAAILNPLPDLPALPPMAQIRSAFEETGSVPGTPAAVTGGISKACFVFIAGRQTELNGVRASTDSYGQSDGWDWRPFHPEEAEAVGAMAQQVAGKLGMRFQELPCDAQLPARLKEAKRNRVPALLMTDAWSLYVSRYADVMTEYDDLNLANCAVLMPWNERDSETVASRANLRRKLLAVCPQKALSPPPLHHWDSINSMDELRRRTMATLDEIRMRLMQIILGEAGDGDVRKVQSAALASSAAEQGITLETQPQLQNTPGAKS